MRVQKTKKKKPRAPKTFAPKPVIAPLVLRPESAATFSGVSEQRLWRHRKDGTGPRFVRMGRSVGYLVPDLTAWLESQRAVGVIPRPVRGQKAAS